MQTFFLFVFGFIAACYVEAGLASDRTDATNFFFPFQVFDGAVPTPQNLSVAGGIDAPKMLSEVNDTAFEWWHFDVVSRSNNQSVAIDFYNFGKSSLEEVPYPGGPLVVQVSGTFENGTSFLRTGNVTSNATFSISPVGDIASFWTAENGDIYLFTGGGLQDPNRETSFSIALDSDEMAIKAVVDLNSTSPSRYACDLDKPGVAQEFFPGVYWSNAVPFGEGRVQLLIDGEVFAFDGFGYHDKTWGVRPLSMSVMGSWVRAHGYVGNHSFVVLYQHDKPFTLLQSSVFITDPEGNIVRQCCDCITSIYRLADNKASWPPSGYIMTYYISSSNSSSTGFTTEVVQLGTETLGRFVGSTVDQDGHDSPGRALFEEIWFPESGSGHRN